MAFNGDLNVGLEILTSKVNPKTRKILLQLGDVRNETTDTDNAEQWQEVGFVSRASKPEPGKAAAQTVSVKCGDHDIVISTQDLRGLELAGQLDFGETCVYAPGEDGTAQARILLKKDGSINLFTKKGNATDGTGLGIFINTDGSISIVGPDGQALLLGADKSVKLFNGGGSVQVAADGGVKITSTTKMSISAPSVVLGGSPLGAPVLNTTDLLAYSALVVTALNASLAPAASAASAAFTTAVTAMVAGLQATKRTTAD